MSLDGAAQHRHIQHLQHQQLLGASPRSSCAAAVVLLATRGQVSAARQLGGADRTASSELHHTSTTRCLSGGSSTEAARDESRGTRTARG